MTLLYRFSIIIVLIGSTTSCGSSSSTKLEDGTYNLSAVTCQTGTVTADGEAFSAAVSQVAVVASGGTVLAVATTNGDCIVTTSGDVTYSGDKLTYSYDDAAWETDGAGACPSDVTAASHSYSFIVGDGGNVSTFADDADDPNYLSSYCTSGKVGRTFEKQ